MKFLSNSLNRTTNFLSMIGTYWVFGLMIIIVLDVCGRIFFNKPLIGTPEIVKNSLVVIVFLQLAFTMFKQRHVRSALVLDKLPPVVAICIDIFSYLIGAAIFVGIIVSSWKSTVLGFSIREFEIAGSLKIPTYPVRMIIILGSVLMIWQCLRLIIVKIRELNKSKENSLINN